MVLESVAVSFFYKWLTSFPTPLVKEIVFSPYIYFASFVKDKVSIGVWIYLWAFYFVPLIYISVFFFFASTILSRWLWLCGRDWSQAGCFVQFHSSFSRFLWLFRVLYFHKNREIICSSSLKTTVGDLIWIALNLYISLGSILIFTILILPIHEHDIFIHLLVSSLISFISVL